MTFMNFNEEEILVCIVLVIIGYYVAKLFNECGRNIEGLRAGPFAVKTNLHDCMQPHGGYPNRLGQGPGTWCHEEAGNRPNDRACSQQNPLSFCCTYDDTDSPKCIGYSADSCITDDHCPAGQFCNTDSFECDEVKYKCESGQCRRVSNGDYDTDSCGEGCGFKCDSNTGMCISTTDPNSYPTQEACQTNCSGQGNVDILNSCDGILQNFPSTVFANCLETGEGAYGCGSDQCWWSPSTGELGTGEGDGNKRIDQWDSLNPDGTVKNPPTADEDWHCDTYNGCMAYINSEERCQVHKNPEYNPGITCP